MRRVVQSAKVSKNHHWSSFPDKPARGCMEAQLPMGSLASIHSGVGGWEYNFARNSGSAAAGQVTFSYN